MTYRVAVPRALSVSWACQPREGKAEMTTTKITLQGNETFEELREIARQLFKQARAERKAEQLRVCDYD